jgi:hypothetical protein
MLPHHKKYIMLAIVLILAGAVGVVATAQAQCGPTDLMCMTTP